MTIRTLAKRFVVSVGVIGIVIGVVVVGCVLEAMAVMETRNAAWSRRCALGGIGAMRTSPTSRIINRVRG